MDPAVERLVHAVAETRRLTTGRTRNGVPHDRADECSGSVDTDDAHGFDPFPLLRALSASGVRVVVMGQVAGILHGSRELTGDLDLLWNGAPDDASALAEAFASAAAAVADGDGRAVACEAAAFRLEKVLFRTPAASGDCCTPRLPWGSLDIVRIIERAEVTQEDGGARIHYASIDDLITMRLAAGRPKDLRRAAELAGLRNATVSS